MQSYGEGKMQTQQLSKFWIVGGILIALVLAIEWATPSVAANISKELPNNYNLSSSGPDNFIQGIASPTWPATFPFSQWLNYEVTYHTTEPGGVLIFVLPFSNGNLSIVPGISGSGLYPTGWGHASGRFTVYGNGDDGAVVVDQLKVQMWNTAKTEVLYEAFFPVNYKFTGATQSSTFTWYQGQDPVRMLRSYNSVCFLTAMGGKFEGSGEVIRIAEYSNEWNLEGGASKQKDVAASARCIVGLYSAPLEVSGVFNWHQANNAPTRMMPIADNICFLTEISGRFHGAGEAVQIVWDDGYWWLTGRSRQKDVRANAICIKRGGRSVSDEYIWHQGEPYKELENSVCFLTSVSGKFNGSGEWVTVDYHPTLNKFILWGGSKQKDVQAGARCLSYP
ncbi:MAG: hypothetical protein U0586_17070 [Candidatus Brocadiaceae bacterium]